MGRRSLSIRVHLAIYGALIILPLLAAGLVIAKLHLDKERAAQEARAQQIVANATAAIDHELNRYKLALQVLASSEMLVEGKLESFYLRAQALSESIPDSSIALRRANGEWIFLTSEPFGEPIAGDVDPGLRAADRLAIEHRSAVITDLISDSIRPRLVAIEVPVVTAGKVDYLLMLGISPKGVLDILTPHLPSPGWRVAVIGNNDRIIARSGENDDSAGQKASDEFIRNMQGKAGNFIASTSEDGAAFNVYQRSELSGWRVAAAIPLVEFDSPRYQSLQIPAIVAGIFFACALILAVFYARRFTTPLRQLQGLAESSGNEKAVPFGIAELDGVTGTLMRSIVVLKDRDRARARTVSELNHRMKNMLAIIQAIAEQTRRRVTSLEQFGRIFESRLVALAKSHEALGDPEWHSGDLGSLISQTCRPFCDESRLVLQGPPVELPAKATIGIGMVIHELATNAAKYGALSHAGGTVKVRWDMPEEGGLRILRLQWQEQNAPPLQATRKEGFGTSLLHSILETDLGGKLDISFTREGLHLIACIPMNVLVGPPIVPLVDEAETARTGR